MTYGGTVPTIVPVISGLQNGDDASDLGSGVDCSTAANTTSPVGSYATACDGAVDANYDISYVDGSVTVNPAALTVTASSPSMAYGDSPPAITASYDGFVNGDSASSLTTAPTCSTTATSASPVGSYPTSCAGAVDPNYPSPMTTAAAGHHGTHRGHCLVGLNDLRRGRSGHHRVVLGIRER